MPFVKLDCGILNSTLWFQPESRDVFLTALLMAEPTELTEPTPQLQVRSLKETGWSVPAGWYGLVPAAGIGIIHRSRVPEKAGFEALEMLGSPEKSSRSQDFEGRRLVRIDGGYLVLNFMKYRERDYTAADRARRYRERLAAKKSTTSHRNVSTSRRDITQAEAEAEADPKKDSRASALGFEDFWARYPKKRAKDKARQAWNKRKMTPEDIEAILSALELQVKSIDWLKEGGQFIPYPATYINQGRWNDELVQEDFYRARL